VIETVEQRVIVPEVKVTVPASCADEVFTVEIEAVKVVGTP
jgi:hypothetical protein